MPRRIGSLLFAVASALLTLLILLSFAKPSRAADYTVGGSCGITIQDCIDFASAGDTVIIPDGLYKENIVLDKAVSLQGESITGTMLNVGGEGRVLLITGTAVLSDTVIENLSILNGDVSGGNICSDQFDVSNCGGGVLIAGGAYPTLRNVLIGNNSAYYGGGLYVERDSGVVLDTVELAENSATQVGGGGVFHGETTLVNSRFVGNRSSNSGGGASISATFPGYPKFQVVISGTEFISNTAVCTSFSCSLHGGGLRIFELDVVISHSRFENNRCAGETERCTGGGLSHAQAFNPVSLTLQETDFISNSAQYNGGGVSFDATFSDTLRLSGGRFISNSVVITEVSAFGGEGGGLFVRDAAAVITGTAFISNTALRLGGGLYMLGPAEIAGALFQANQVLDGHGGGGAFEFVGAVTLTETVWVSNTASLNGGGLYSSVPVEINDGRFEGNRSLGGDSSGNPEGGGGIYATRPLTLTHVDFVNNRANQNGGAIMMLNGQPLRIEGGRFEQNDAAGQGSPIQRGGGSLFIVGDVAAAETVFISNTAVLTNSFNTLNTGGAGYIFGSAVLDHVQVLDNAAYNAGGGFYVSAGLVMTDTLFSGNEALAFSGGGLFASGDVEIRGSDFISNRAGGSGGGLNVSQGDVVLEQTMIYSNTAVNGGGGLSVFGGVGGVTVTITSAEFQHNTVTVGSGAGASIFVGIGGQTLVSDTLWANNAAVGNGGALSLDTGVIQGGLIADNDSGGGGGGLIATGLVQLNGVEMARNTAVGNGGGVNGNSNVLVQDSWIALNETLEGDGGGIWGNSAVIMTDTQIVSNTAAYDGGGVYARLGFDTAVYGVYFQDNAAGHAGGGLYVGRRLALSERSWFIHNTAALGGGLAISNTSGTAEMTVVNNLFARNQAAEQGAAVYLQSPRPLHLVHTTIADIGLNPQAAVYAVSSTLQMTNTIVASHTVGLVNVGGQMTATATVYFGNGAAYEGVVAESETVFGNPRFQEPAVDDYRLGVGSVAIDNALEVGVTADILGMARPVNTLPDRGAYEGPFVYTLRIPIVFAREES